MAEWLRDAWRWTTTSLGDAWGWAATEDGSGELLTWLYVLGMPVAAAVLLWMTHQMRRQTRIKTRLGGAVTALYFGMSFIFAAFGLLATNSLAVLHGWYMPDFWWRTTLRAVLALAAIFVAVTAVRAGRELRRSLE